MHELAINLVCYFDPNFAQLWKQLPHNGVMLILHLPTFWFAEKTPLLNQQQPKDTIHGKLALLNPDLQLTAPEFCQLFCT